MPVGLQQGYGTNMKSELAEEILELIEARSHAPTPTEFEMAYQAASAREISMSTAYDNL